jgi:formylglycine-generating enzyme required for sulfatase activity
MKFVRIPTGTFLMGSPRGEANRSSDEDQQVVQINRPYWLGVYEVTQAQWQEVMGSNPSYFSRTGRGSFIVGMNTDNYPVENVSWQKVQGFLEKLSVRDRERARGRKYRLPTSAEWEYACRGGASTYKTFYYGNTLSHTQANYNANIPYHGGPRGPTLGRTCEVGSYQPNGYGLYDMHGNVWEWCSDVSGPAKRVIRGGSWSNPPEGCRSACRRGNSVTYQGIDVGFRVVLMASK